MIITIASTATIDHRTGATLGGGPASRYHRVARCDGRPSQRPNYAARRLGALFVALSSLMVGAWLVGEVASGVAGRPVIAADDMSSVEVDAAPQVVRTHVARAGDTLWSIADQHRDGTGRTRYVDALVALNGSTAIEVGQAVRLP